ncbi:MAG TPA: nucleotide exchange factor GrpE [Gemmatales bacterium]|nr:nucleotide exchange factor GrpE [Gemmatales bacterium]
MSKKIIVNEEAAPELASETVQETQDELGKVIQERDKYLDLLRRTQADFDNYQKRSLRENETERKYAQRGLALEVLPALDNLERFLSTIKQETDATKAVVMVQKQLLDGLSRQGIKKMACVGQPFDPNLHQAIMEQPSDKPVGTILIEAESGYVYNDRVLRPAKVIVAKNV